MSHKLQERILNMLQLCQGKCAKLLLTQQSLILHDLIDESGVNAITGSMIRSVETDSVLANVHCPADIIFYASCWGILFAKRTTVE